MKYETIKRDVSNRIFGKFYGHSDCVNEKYRSIRADHELTDSDRDRFVRRFFKRFEKKYIVMIDREVIGYTKYNFITCCQPKSVYARRDDDMPIGEPVLRISRKYLAILGFRAVNEMYGRGYVEMSCIDHLGNSVCLRLDEYNLSDIQFYEISEDMFGEVSAMFSDDRETVPFKVTRYLTYQEMKDKKIKWKDKPVEESVTVMAKDLHEAAKMVDNAVSVEPVDEGGDYD